MVNKQVKRLSTNYTNYINLVIGCNWINKVRNNGIVSINGLRKRHEWKNALIVLCGDTFYNVTDKANIYNELAIFYNMNDKSTSYNKLAM